MNMAHFLEIEEGDGGIVVVTGRRGSGMTAFAIYAGQKLAAGQGRNAYANLAVEGFGNADPFPYASAALTLAEGGARLRGVYVVDSFLTIGGARPLAAWREWWERLDDFLSAIADRAEDDRAVVIMTAQRGDLERATLPARFTKLARVVTIRESHGEIDGERRVEYFRSMLPHFSSRTLAAKGWDHAAKIRDLDSVFPLYETRALAPADHAAAHAATVRASAMEAADRIADDEAKRRAFGIDPSLALTPRRGAAQVLSPLPIADEGAWS